jgi:spore coat polysaccharide biosynthesis predicted glycosyltransferase SpsG
MESELPKLSEILDKEDIILVDSYQVTYTYYKELGKLCKTACLEDMGEPYPVGKLFNYNIYAPNLRKQYEENADKEILPDKVYLGLEFMPLREAFRTDTEYNLRDKVTDIMVTTGGSDPLYAAGAILEKIMGIPGITIHVVSGPFNQNADRLKAEYAMLPNVVIHENLKDLKSLMKQCDVVVTATGSTIYEVSVIGVPMICFYFAENQRQGAEELERLTDIVNAGCFAENPQVIVDNIYDALIKCIDSYDYRRTIHNQEKNLVDGNGADRIVSAIIDCNHR